MLKWLELTPDYECNNRCVGCFSLQDASPSMSPQEILHNLVLGIKQGMRWLWIGGGDPTLRRDLLFTVVQAKRLGYSRIKLQTNGMLLADPAFTRKCAAAGVTEVNFAIKGATPEMHDALTDTPGCHEQMMRGMAEVRKLGLAMEGDILVYRRNASAIPEMVKYHRDHGVARFNLWLFSAVDQGRADLAAEVPRIAEVVPHVVAAMDLGLSEAPDFITSLHTPPCTVPPSHHACLFHAPDLGLLVTNPGGYRFRLEESPIEGGVYKDGCAGCAMRARCGGMRADYVRIHGDSEFEPIP